MKLFMDTLHIPYVEIKDELTMYVATGLIRKVVHGTLTPYQLTWFFIEFNIINVSMWLDFFFDQVQQLFKNLQNNDGHPTQDKRNWWPKHEHWWRPSPNV